MPSVPRAAERECPSAVPYAVTRCSPAPSLPEGVSQGAVSQPGSAVLAALSRGGFHCCHL